jgi:hypothetical protein
MVEIINNSYLTYYDNPPIHIREYYYYCLGLLKYSMRFNQKPINVIFGDLQNHHLDMKTIKIDIQCEHTLVKNGGRSVSEIIYGETIDSDGNQYLIRIDKFKYFNELNYIIEYSYPNYHHISTSHIFNDYLKKNIVIEPILLKPEFSNLNKTETITLFSNNVSQRRDILFNKLRQVNNNIKIISDCFDGDCLTDQYRKTRIMINIHQTDHHHTFEELRVLPALSQGVVIISENVPLKELIPYNEFIIWSDYKNLTETLKNVEENYDYYYNKLFNKKLTNLLNDLSNDNKLKFLNLFN